MPLSDPRRSRRPGSLVVVALLGTALVTLAALLAGPWAAVAVAAVSFAGALAWAGLLLQSLARYQSTTRSFLDVAGDAVLLLEPETERILDANPAACTLYGYSQDEIVGMSVRSFSEDATAGENATEQLLREGGTASFDSTQYRRDGTPVRVRIRATLTRIGGRPVLVSINRDVTDEEWFSEELARRNRELQAIANNAQHLIVRFDRDLRHRFVNHAVTEATGLPEEAFLGKTAAEVGLSPEEIAVWTPPLETALATGASGKFECNLTTAEGVRTYVCVVVPEQEGCDGPVVSVLCMSRDVTDERHVEDALDAAQHEARQLAHVVSQVSDGIIVTDTERRAVWVNDAMERISGFLGDDIIGLRPADLMQGPDTDPTIAARIDAHVEARESFTAELLNHRPDGSTYWLHISCTPLIEKGQFAGYVAIETDVTERRRAQEALGLQEARFRNLVHHSSDVISILDSEGQILYESPASEHVLGYRPEDLVGRSVFEFLHEDDAEAVASAFNIVILNPGQAVPVMFRWRHADGSWVDLEAVGTNRLDDSSIQGIVVNSRDVGQSLRYEAERSARKRAEEMLRLKSSFLSNMSHEIRTPLTAVMGYSEMLVDEVRPELRDLAVAVQSGGERLMNTLTSVLDLAQIEAGEMTPQPRPVDVGEHLCATIQALRPLADAKGIALGPEVSPDLPVVSLDPGLLDRVVTNLIGNAIKFTETGAVDVQVGYSDGHLHIDVTDTGIGIEPGGVERLFEAFQQASDGRTRSHEGNGLGLTIARNVVTLLGGEISVESTLGEGARFSVRVPAEAVLADR